MGSASHDPDASSLRIALAQINPTVGAIEANARLIVAQIEAAREAGAALVLFPELVICGYPPEDLLLKEHFVAACEEALEEVAEAARGIVALVGFPEATETDVYNSLGILADGALHATYRKIHLPNYGIFDERRYFAAGEHPGLLKLGSVAIGLTICEDIWFAGYPSTDLVAAGAQLILNASASPYHRGKGSFREQLVAERVAETGVPLALCNLVGGQDELIFDGHSAVVGGDGTTLARGPQFAPELIVCQLTPTPSRARIGATGVEVVARFDAPDRPSHQAAPPAPLAAPLSDVAEVYLALQSGLHDYCAKNRFAEIVIALSGGIDSALVALLAVDAIGADAIHLVSMPSPHSSSGTQADARQIALNLGSDFLELPINAAMSTFDELLAKPFSADTNSAAAALAEENLQARIRGMIVMALSNRFGWLVVATGNKSEMSVGYATLYGDMAGGFALIKDVPKTLVYDLVRYRNEQAETELIPQSVIDRAPSAELRPDQRDSDSLPDYELLDRILEEYVELDRSREEIVATEIDADAVDRVLGLVDRAEYKRRQAPPGVRISPKAFGRDRRLPITNRFGG